jgi:D-aminoacyl-tRNA deacylase
MRLCVQRVTKASVSVNGKVIGAIDQGLLVFVGFKKDETTANLTKAADKLFRLRIFSDEDGKMNRNVQEIKGSLLLVSQFTLYADALKGNRPSFGSCLAFDDAEKIYEQFVVICKRKWNKIETGSFGADMQVTSINDGPVTLWLEYL